MEGKEILVEKTASPMLHKRAKGVLTALAFAIALSLFTMAACSPKVSSSDDIKPAESEPAIDLATTGYTSMTDVDSGPLPETFWSRDWINDGSRGCNSCHEDLWDLVADIGPLVHLASTDPGYGRNATWTDCGLCHMGVQKGGMYLTDAIHSRHYSSKVFTDELNGTCFNCHALNKDGEYVMYDWYRHSSQFGGYGNALSEPVQDWVKARGYETGNMAGITTQSDMPLKVVDLNQNPTNEEDDFSALNYAVPEIDDKTFTIKVTGVVNEQEFTLADLQAMPQTELTAFQACGANNLGSYQIANVPVKGVLLKDFIEACGGLKEGVTSIDVTGADGWYMRPLDLEAALENDALFVLEEWGKPLTVDNGYPVAFGVPGFAASAWTKYVCNFDFVDKPGMSDMFTLSAPYKEGPLDATETDLSTAKVSYDMTKVVHPIHVFWTNPVNENETLTMNNGVVSLTGLAYVWGTIGHGLDQIAFSADYGNTWTYVDVPEDFDSHQVVTWSVDWTPDGPGTYVLYACGIDRQAGWQELPSAITVVVE